MERRLERLNWKQFGQIVPRKTDAVLLPVGTIEAHGPGALGTDAIIPAYLAGRLSGPLNAMVAPAVSYGVTGSLIAYPGSLTVGPETLRAYVREIAFSLADAGFKKIIVLNGHGGNIGSLNDLGAGLWKEKRAGCLVVHWWLATETEAARHFDGTGHAGADEMAALTAVDPSLVTKADYRREDAGHRFPGIDQYPFYRSIILNQPGRGYPSFRAGQAKRYMEAVVARLTSDIEQVLAGWEQVI